MPAPNVVDPQRMEAVRYIPQIMSTNGVPQEVAEHVIWLVLITRDIANEFLARNKENRPKKHSGVTRYSRDLKAGRWMINGEAIRFDRDGRLIDGQNRLYACQESGEPFWTYVIEGMDPAVFATIDIGIKRSLGDILAARGYKNANILGSAAAEFWRWERGYPGLSNPEYRPAHETALDLIDEHPGLQTSTDIAVRMNRIGTPTVAAACHYRFAAHDRELADWFMERLSEGDKMEKHYGVLHLREQLLDVRSDDRKTLSRRHEMALTVKAWNAHREGRKVKVLRWSETERFPKIA